MESSVQQCLMFGFNQAYLEKYQVHSLLSIFVSWLLVIGSFPSDCLHYNVPFLSKGSKVRTVWVSDIEECYIDHIVMMIYVTPSLVHHWLKRSSLTWNNMDNSLLSFYLIFLWLIEYVSPKVHHSIYAIVSLLFLII